MHDQDSRPQRPPIRGRLLVNPLTRTLDPPPRGRLLVRHGDPPPLRGCLLTTPTIQNPSPSDDQPTTTIPPLSKYDAFISFRGEDIRNKFLSHLYTHMHDRSIETYKDDVSLRRGDQISPALARGIEMSSTYVVVFSPNYATSKWCLDELVKILECSVKYGRKLIPIFYDGVDPSIVKNRTGSYGDAFKEHEKLPPVMQPKVQRWRDALREAAHFAGFDSLVVTPESRLIREVAKSVLDAVIPHQKDPSPSMNNLVGIDHEIEKINALLDINDEEKNRIIGLWGMGGIGKTTLAKEIFYNIDPERFESCHYIQNFAAQLKRTQVTDLQNELFSILLQDESAHTMPMNLKLNRLSRKRCFVIIDDVSSTIQLEALLLGRYRDLFGPGSRIILTSTDRQVLRQVCEVKEIHKVKGLDADKALQLLSMYALKKDSPPSEYAERCKKVVSYASGNPLALKVLGSALYQQKIEYWDGTLEKLRSLPATKEIEDILMISFDELSDEEQNAFLDIACFFNHEDLDFVRRVLDDVMVTNLVDKSLAAEGSTDDNKGWIIEMHALLQHLGERIVNKEKLIGNRSRLWNPNDVHPLINQNMGTENTQGIFLDLSKTEEMSSPKSDSFERMRNLRLLSIQVSMNRKLNSAHDLPLEVKKKKMSVVGGIKSLPRELRYLQWDLFTQTSLPSGLWAQNLLVLRLKHSNILHLWEGPNLDLGNLKELNLFASKFLTNLPDLSTSKKLEVMDLTSCTSLTELHDSIINLPSLKILIVNSCGALNLDNLNNKEDGKNPAFPSLEEANLDKTPIDMVPHLIIYAPNLSKLSCSSCLQLSEFPNTSEPQETLLQLNVSNCGRISAVPARVTNFLNLKVFDLSGTGILVLPYSVLELDKLEELKFAQCKKLVIIPRSFKRLTHLEKLELQGCDLLINQKPELPDGLEYTDDGEHNNTKSKVRK